MKLFMYSIFDRASGVYDRPFPARSDAEASRSFGDIACDKNHPIGAHPDDFTLYNIGTYEDSKGALEGTDPVKVINGDEAVSMFGKPDDINSFGGTQ